MRSQITYLPVCKKQFLSLQFRSSQTPSKQIMGVKNLWKLLKESSSYMEKNMNWLSQNGSIWAVDLSFWIVEASTAMQHLKFTDPCFRPHLRNLFFRIKHLLSLGIRLIFVFDGAPPPQKFLTLQKRGVLGNLNRRNNKKKYSQSVFGRQCKECKQLLEILGVPYIDLKYGEAEAFCSKLNKYGIVNAVLTPDGDSFLFGANKIFTQYQTKNPTISCCDINKSDLSQRKFIALGLLLGTDYTEGVKGIGYKRAGKLLDSAMDLYGFNKNGYDNDNNDWLFHILKWCQMNDTQIERLFESQATSSGVSRKKNKTVENFVLSIRETYDDIQYLEDIIEAYLNPEFHNKDEEKLFNKKWLKWRCPNFVDMMMFSQTYFQMDMKNIIQHTLDMTFDLYLFGFVDKSDLNKFEITNIIKSRVRNKIAMYSVQWKCNDEEVNKEIFDNEELEGIKSEGLHWADAMQQLQSDLVLQFEDEKANKKKKKSKPKARTKKKDKNKDEQQDASEAKPRTKKKKNLEGKGKSKKKKNNYNYKRGYYPQTDWKAKIDTSKKAAIYTQNLQELNNINNLLATVSNKGKRKQQNHDDIQLELDFDDHNEENMNMNDCNLNQRKKRKPMGRNRRKGKCLLSDSSDDDGNNARNNRKKKKNKDRTSNDKNINVQSKSNSNSICCSSDELHVSLIDRIVKKEEIIL